MQLQINILINQDILLIYQYQQIKMGSLSSKCLHSQGDQAQNEISVNSTQCIISRQQRFKKKILEQNFGKVMERGKKEKQQRVTNYIQNAEKTFTKQICLAKIAQEGRNKVIFIGNTCVGKSSLINKLYGLNLKTGKLQTTFGYQKVNTVGKAIDIYDSEVYNQENNDEQFKLWENLNYYKIVFILYQDTLKASKNMIECLCKPKDRVYKIYFVCTKCDLWDDSNNKTIDEEINQQKKYLSQMGISNVDKIKFFKSSARKDSFEGGQNENYKIAKLISQLENPI